MNPPSAPILVPPELTGQAAEPARDAVYPEEAPPVPETDANADQRNLLKYCLRRWFERAPDVYVSGDLFLYYEQGNPQAVVAPDVFVVFGVGNHSRRTFRVWEEGGRTPDFVLEVVSPATVERDTGDKMAQYAALGVREYVLFDRFYELLQPRLQLYVLEDGRYRRADAAADGSVTSAVLGLDLRIRDGWLRLWDRARGAWIPAPEEERDAREAAEVRAAALEAEVARLRELLARKEG